MSKILVTGASGFIGKALTVRLKTQGLSVISVDSSNGDIANRETLVKFLSQNITHVFHLAGKTFVPNSWNDPQSFYQTNVMGTFNLLEFCKKKVVPLTYVSAYVYGHQDSLPIKENAVVQPSNPYALTKRLAEETCEFYARTYDMPVTTLRPFNVYGIGQAGFFLIPKIISQTLDAGKEISVKDLTPRRDYIYLEDFVTALMATLDKPCKYRVYNIGSGISLSVQGVIDTAQIVAGTQKRVVCDKTTRTNELLNVVADISKAGKELDWYPKFSFQAGIENIISSEQEKRNNEQA